MEQEFYYYVASGFILMVLPVAFIAGVWLRGFFFPFLKVKASQGRLVLVRLRGSVRDHYTTGDPVDGTLRFKVKKDYRTINMEPLAIYRSWNMNCIDIDEEKNSIILRDGQHVEGFDAQKFDDIIERALKKPNFDNNKQLVVLILLIIIILVLLANAGMTYQLYKAVTQVNSITTAAIGGF